MKKFSNVDQSIVVSDNMLELQKGGNKVSDGKLERLEQMLISQAIALDTIFNRLALKLQGQIASKITRCSCGWPARRRPN